MGRHGVRVTIHYPRHGGPPAPDLSPGSTSATPPEPAANSTTLPGLFATVATSQGRARSPDRPHLIAAVKAR